MRIEHRVFWCTYMGREYHILLNLPRSFSLWRWYPYLHRYLPCVEILTDWNHYYLMRRQERYSTPTPLLESHMKPHFISPSDDPDLKHPTKRLRRVYYIFELNLTSSEDVVRKHRRTSEKSSGTIVPGIEYPIALRGERDRYRPVVPSGDLASRPQKAQ